MHRIPVRRSTIISSGEKWAIGIVNRYKPGTATLAWYNPAKPNEAYLVHEASIFPYIFILFPMIFSCIGLAILFQGRPPVVPTVAWNVVGIAVAAHYFGIGGKLDLGAKIAFMIYGLIGAVLIYATVQMPPGIPVATVAIDGARNAALLVVQMLAIGDDDLARQLADHRKEIAG